jgi:hypothetical protein
MYQKPVIDHCPWPSSQFNKWHAQNKLLSSSLIVIGSSPWFTPPSNQRTIVAARLVYIKVDRYYFKCLNSFIILTSKGCDFLSTHGGQDELYGRYMVYNG